DQIQDAFDTLMVSMPPEASKVTQWFEKTYIGIRQDDTMDRNLPLFHPQLWSVYESVELGIPRTQNSVEAWHNRWNTIVGRPNVSVYMLIEELQKEQQNVDDQVVRILQGESRPRPNQYYIEKEKRIMAIFNDHKNRP
ncbi:1033_t:CDS:1, partial [Dentiscutata erythropus]